MVLTIGQRKTPPDDVVLIDAPVRAGQVEEEQMKRQAVLSGWAKGGMTSTAELLTINFPHIARIGHLSIVIGKRPLSVPGYPYFSVCFWQYHEDGSGQNLF